MKKYILLLGICYISLDAMELEPFPKPLDLFIKKMQDRKVLHDKADLCVEKVRGAIDEYDLQVNPKGLFGRPIGYYYSLQKACSLSCFKDICSQASIIESRINIAASECDLSTQNKLILKKLIPKHYLVQYVMNKLIDIQAARFQILTSFNLDIDAICEKNDFPVSLFLQSFIQKAAIKKYSSNNGIDKNILFVPFDQRENEIHYTVLSCHQNVDISRNQLLMSSDSKYLRAVYPDETKTIWDMEKGTQVVMDDTHIKWARYDEYSPDITSDLRVIDLTCNYLAIDDRTPTAYISKGIADILENAKSKNKFVPIIVLFKRPTFESMLCFNTFLDGARDGNEEALLKLKESQVIKKVIGFVGAKLSDLIDLDLAVIRRHKSLQENSNTNDR